MAKLNRRKLCGFRIREGFFNSTIQNMKLSTKAKAAITLKVTSSTVSDWLVSIDGFGWLDRTFGCVGLLLLASRSVANALYSDMLNSQAFRKKQPSEKCPQIIHILHLFVQQNTFCLNVLDLAVRLCPYVAWRGKQNYALSYEFPGHKIFKSFKALAVVLVALPIQSLDW